MAPKKIYTAAQLLERKRDCERRRREKRKNDPELRLVDKEKMRKSRLRRKKVGLDKPIAQLSAREQRAIRKKWRESSKKHYLKKKALLSVVASPTTSSEFGSSELSTISTPGSGRKASGRRAVNCYKSRVYRNLVKEKKTSDRLKKLYQKYKQRCRRLIKKNEKSKLLSPKSKVNVMLADSSPAGMKAIRRRLFFGEVLWSELINSINCHSRKKELSKLLKGDILQKYRALSVVGEFFSYRMYKTAMKRNIKNHKNEKQLQNKSILIQTAVHKFLKNDENSRLCAGKKDYVKGKHQLYQKRYMNDTLKNLYKKYNAMPSTPKVSYSTFCRMKPVYIVKATHTARDTCLCLRHENFELLLQKLCFLNVVPYKTITAITESVCCETVTEKCLFRKCSTCKNKTIKIYEFDGAKNVFYGQWLTIIEERTIKGQKKNIKRVIKKHVNSNLKDVVEKLFMDFDGVMQHVARMRSQQKAFNALRIRPNELTLQVDFSENYVCKNAAEPQSVHFGASRQQLSLHTVVAWCNKEKNSLCTVSENLRHDAKAVLAHLKPVLDYLLLEKYSTVDTIHFLSDGPSAQYRNRTMFTIIGKCLPKHYPRLKNITWNYSEAGHGKGPVDGVGAVLKRTADRLVAENKDVANISQFMDQLKASIERVRIIQVTGEEMTAMDNLIAQETIIPTVKGTMRTHQVTFNTAAKNLRFDLLSCLHCAPGTFCPHYSTGTPCRLEESSLDERGPSSSLFCASDLKESDWVAAVYDDVWYPGIVERLFNDGSFEVNFMSRSGQNLLFLWPSVPDRQMLRPEGVLYVLKNPPTPVTGRLSRVDEYKYIEFLKNNIIDQQ